MVGLDTIRAAWSRITPHVFRTPFYNSGALSAVAGVPIDLKCEHLQQTGSFKLRGATNKILRLADEGVGQVVTASSGNHGAGVARAAHFAGIDAHVFVPSKASPSKLAGIAQYQATLHKVDGDGLQAELTAAEFAKQNNLPYISPYNDADIISGQGTIGLEMLDQDASDRPLDRVFVSVGGGGLISGIATALKSKLPDVEIVGCWPDNAPAMLECIKAGEIIDVEETDTLSDGTAGGVEPGAITFPICTNLIDTSVRVTESEIAGAMRLAAEKEHFIIEGAAAVALAAALKSAEPGKRHAVVLCGRNIELEVFAKAIAS